MKDVVLVGQVKLRKAATNLFQGEEGQDLIEYALLAALIAIAAIVVIILVGPELRNVFQDIVNALQRTS